MAPYATSIKISPICCNEFLRMKHSSGELFFSDEATFHVSGKLNKHYVRIWGKENPYASRELQ